MTDDLPRCFGTGDPLMTAYHDLEWGVPVRDDQALFEKLVLDSFQAGLSWRTILYKRDNFRRAFHGFDPTRIAGYGPRDIERLMRDAGIVRNRLKIEAAIGNARTYLQLRESRSSFSDYLWGFTEQRVFRGPPSRSWKTVPTRTVLSDAMAKDLKALGFRFVGTTICYAFMQAVGMVDDHLTTCHRYCPDDRPPARRGRSASRPKE
ncbi:MAG: DNA-3-methyladenine glycosylase I [Anaerolineales bacterium]|nr:DNA-3-methyladenine glycosylase I [Anaerolineales bacterium]